MNNGSSRWWWSATGIVLLVWALELFPSVNEVPAATGAVVVVGLVGLLTLAGSLIDPFRPRALVDGSGGASNSLIKERPYDSYRVNRIVNEIGAWAIAVLVVLTFVLWSFLQVRASPSYGSDEIAFDQYAATLAIHGENPYAHSMQPSFQKYQVSPNNYTFHLDGTPVTSLSYPALSFEFYLPFLAAGWSNQLAVGINVIFWGASLLLLFGMLPRHLRASALVIGSLATYVSFTVGGITDVLYVPLLIGAAYRWQNWPFRTGWRAFVSPALFGLAMAVKQTPWFVLPFLLIAICFETRQRTNRLGMRSALRYLAISIIAFLIPNVPYLVSAPYDWFRGVLTPLISHSVPAGQGLIGLSLYLRFGGGSLFGYSVLTVIVLVALLATFTVCYPMLRNLTFVLPSIVLFFAARSYSSYLIMLAPAALIAVASSHRKQFDRPLVGEVRGGLDETQPDDVLSNLHTSQVRTLVPWKSWKLVAAGGLAVTLATVGYVLSATSPLALSIAQVRTTGQLATVERITIRVKNRTDSVVHPAFSVDTNGVLSAFWSVYGRSITLGPYSSSTYTIVAPNFLAQPPITGGFTVTAFTTSPASVSSSAPYIPTTWHVSLQPSAISKAVPLNHPIKVTAQLFDRFDQAVHVAGIPIYLGQIIYDEHGLEFGVAKINSSAPGFTPVSALTKANGTASFTIEGTKSASDPVYFEANLVNFTQFFPYGYSQILPIRFGTSP